MPRPLARILLLALTLVLGPAPAGGSELTELLKREKSVLGPLEQLSDQVLRTEQELLDARRQEELLAYRLAEAKRRLKALRERTGGHRRNIKKRLTALYKLSRGGFARLVLDNAGAQDLFPRLSATARVVERDLQEVALYRREMTRYRTEQARLEQQKARQSESRARLEALHQQLKRRREAQLHRLWMVRNDRQARMALGQELSTRQQKLLQRIAALSTRVGWAGGFRARRGRLGRPVLGRVMGRFGQRLPGQRRISVMRQGLTFATASRAPVQAVAPGIVRVADAFSGYGQLVLLQHEDNHFSVYGFLASTRVKVGQRVGAGHRLGRTGLDPLTGEPALYFELRHGDRPLDPARWFE